MDSLLKRLKLMEGQDEALKSKIHGIFEDSIKIYKLIKFCNLSLSGDSDASDVFADGTFDSLFNDSGKLIIGNLEFEFPDNETNDNLEEEDIEDADEQSALLSFNTIYGFTILRTVIELLSCNYITRDDFIALFSQLEQPNPEGGLLLREVPETTPREAFETLMYLGDARTEIFKLLYSVDDFPVSALIELENSIDGDSAFEKFSEALKCMDNDSAKFLLNLFSPINCRSLLIFSFILQTFNLMLVDIVNMDLDGIAKRLETIQSNLDILQSAFTNQFVKHDEGGLSLSVSDSALSDFTMSSEFAFRNIILQKLPPSIQAAVQKEIELFWSGVDVDDKECFEKDCERYSQHIEEDKKRAAKDVDKLEKKRASKTDEAKPYIQYATVRVDKKTLIERLVDEDWITPYDTESKEDIKKHLSYFFYDENSPQDVSPDYKLRWNKHSSALNLLIRLLFNRNRNAAERKNVVNEEGGINYENIDSLDGKTWPSVEKVWVGAPKMRYASTFSKEGSEKHNEKVADLEKIANLYFDCKERKEEGKKGN